MANILSKIISCPRKVNSYLTKYHETVNTWSNIMTALTAVLLVFLAFWYTYETKLIREETEKASIQSISPFLWGTIKKPGDSFSLKSFLNNPKNQKDSIFWLEWYNNRNLKGGYYGTIKNHGSSLAFDIGIVVCDDGAFYFCPEIKYFLKPNDTFHFLIPNKRFKLDEIYNATNEYYGDHNYDHYENAQRQKHKTLFIYSLDSQNNLYCTIIRKTSFTSDDSPYYFKSKILLGKRANEPNGGKIWEIHFPLHAKL